MPELSFLSASTLARMIAAREVSVAETLQHFAGRIEAHNASLNAIVAMDMDRAQREAAKADDMLARGETMGPLHGVPMTIKDAFECEGLVSTGGALALKDHVPSGDALAVQRLRAAGAIVIGKTNVPEYSGDWQTYNDVYGTTNNPWNLAHTPGGSSGGAAAAVSAGLAAAEIGSDIGGSIRLPSHFCGLFGLKTSFGVVPTRGHIPPAPHAVAAADLNVAGPIARSAEDLALLFAVLSGDAGDPEHPHPPISPARATDISQMRIAVWREEPDARVSAEAAAAVHMAADALEQAGARVERDRAPEFDFDAAYSLYRTILNAIISTDWPKKLRERLAEAARDLSPDDRSYSADQARGVALSYGGMLSIEAKRQKTKDAWRTFFTGYDAILCPVVPVAAITHDTQAGPPKRRLTVNGEERSYFDLMQWAFPATFAHLPASVAPVTLNDDGLPLGVQIIGPYLGESTVIEVAKALETHCRAFTPPPDFV